VLDELRQQRAAERSPNNRGANSVDSSNTNTYGSASMLSQGAFKDPNYSSTEVGIDDFKIERVIGRGSFGKVYLVRKKTDDKLYAMKTLKKDMILRKNQAQNTKGMNRQLAPPMCVVTLCRLLSS